MGADQVLAVAGVSDFSLGIATGIMIGLMLLIVMVAARHRQR